MRRILLGVNIIALVVLGFTIAHISKLLYREKRINTFVMANVDELISEYTNMLAVLWWILAILFIVAIIQSVLMFRSSKKL